MKKIVASFCLAFLLTCTASAASSREDLQARIDAAKLVLDQIMAANDSSIPLNILQQATCVGIVPGMIKGAFILGAQYGQGVARTVTTPAAVGLSTEPFKLPGPEITVRETASPDEALM